MRPSYWAIIWNTISWQEQNLTSFIDPGVSTPGKGLAHTPVLNSTTAWKETRYVFEMEGIPLPPPITRLLLTNRGGGLVGLLLLQTHEGNGKEGSPLAPPAIAQGHIGGKGGIGHSVPNIVFYPFLTHSNRASSGWGVFKNEGEWSAPPLLTSFLPPLEKRWQSAQAEVEGEPPPTPSPSRVQCLPKPPPLCCPREKRKAEMNFLHPLPIFSLTSLVAILEPARKD